MSKFIRNELNQNAMGGSELMMTRLYDSLGDELDDFQIILSRVRELEDGKWRILWCHDLAEDPEAQHLANGGWQKFHMIVFVSNWQRQSYVDRFNIPWSKTVVMQNAIMPFNDPKPGPRIPGVAPIKMIYHTTPHRGLELLYPIVDRLSESHNVQLNVYSSFKVYGWEQRDEPYKDLFKKIEDHPSMTYHGAVDNSEIRAALVGTDIFLYPCIWQETSCLSLI